MMTKHSTLGRVDQVALINGMVGAGVHGNQQVALINGHNKTGALDPSMSEGLPVFKAPPVLPEQGAPGRSAWPWLAIGLGAVGIGAAVWLAGEE